MACAQRREVPAWGFGRGPYMFRQKKGDVERARKCAECTSLITGEAVIFNREHYCSIDCAREATHAKHVPGHYLG